MSTPLPPLLSRSLAVVLLTAIVAAAVLLVALPLAGRFETVRREIDEKRSILGRLDAIKAAEMGIAAAPEGDPLQLFLAGDSESTILAGLQSRVAEIANLEGVEIRSARALEAIDRDPVRFIGVEVQLTARLEQVQGILIALESGEPYLYVERADLAPAAATGAEGATGSGDLDVRLGVFGATKRKKS